MQLQLKFKVQLLVMFFMSKTGEYASITKHKNIHSEVTKLIKRASPAWNRAEFAVARTPVESLHDQHDACALDRWQRECL
jgi:hypothetical protein